MKARIVIFAKAPLAGAVKTRLIPAIGAEGAARLAQAMLEDTYREAVSVPGAEVEICCAPDPAHPDWLGRLPAQSRAAPQGAGDLGARLSRAAARVTGEGMAVILIGTDCPALGADRLFAACRALTTHEVVTHPAFDGGYALLGLRRHHPYLFQDIAWGGAQVASDTMARVETLGWSLHVGDTLADIDEPEDLIESRYAAFLPAAR